MREWREFIMGYSMLSATSVIVSVSTAIRLQLLDQPSLRLVAAKVARENEWNSDKICSRRIPMLAKIHFAHHPTIEP